MTITKALNALEMVFWVGIITSTVASALASTIGG